MSNVATSVYRTLSNTVKATQEELLWDLVFFIFAGHDTTSAVLVRALMELTRNPEYRTQVLSEIQEHIFEGCDVIASEIEQRLDTEKLEEMTFLKRFVKECLRINPPTFRSIGYSAVKEFTLSDGLVVPKDAMIEFNLTSAHWRPD